MDHFFYLLMTPLFLLRNPLSTFISTWPILPWSVNYQVKHERGLLTFGPSRSLLCNTSELVIDLFRVAGGWAALLRDGYVIFLPPGKAGNEISAIISERLLRKERND
ncbi:MAG TPA: hypothetical protein VH253_18470 [Phycisphaerae bacterium]|nr:hypothetical protein [Phycisphaerae bacterium]